MSPRYGVAYPDGAWSGPITDSHRDAARYARLHHATVYEVGSAEDPCPRHRPEAPPWFGPEYYSRQAGRIERVAAEPVDEAMLREDAAFEAAEATRYQGDAEADAAGCKNEGQANPWLQLADMLQALKVGAGETAKKCDHKNRECTYESDDGEFERWQCKDCGERWGVEIAQ